MAQTPSTPFMRYRRGRQFIKAATPASTLINIGDLLWLNNGVANPASLFTFGASLVLTQPGFKLLFLGVSMDNKLATDPSTKEIEVCTEGVFQFTTTPITGAKHIGQRMGPDKDPGGNFLMNQVLLPVATFDLAIGVLAEESVDQATSVQVWMQSYLLNNPLFA